MKNTKFGTVFLTGGTGLLGSYLAKILLENNRRVYFLVRNSNETARVRIRKALGFWNIASPSRPLRNLDFLNGDLRKEYFGLESKDWEKLIDNVEEIFHCAAITDIAFPLREARSTNVSGTKRLFEFALQCKNIRKINHISTAFVCGDYVGTFTEKHQNVGQKFNNSYFQSKHEAEMLVERYRSKLHIDLFRPALIVGEGKSGRIPQFRNIYQFLDILRFQIFDKLPVLGVGIHIATVDDVAKSIFLLSKYSPYCNRTYHVFQDRKLPLFEFVKVSCDILKLKRPKLTRFEDFNNSKCTFVQQEILKRNFFALNTQVELRSRVTEGLLKKYGFQFCSLRGKNLTPIINYYNKKHCFCEK